MIEFIKFVKHTVAESTGLRATQSGPIQSVKMKANCDNGAIIGLGKYLAPEYYEETTPSATFAGEIIEKAPNGGFRVRVTQCEDGDLLALSVPLIYEEGVTKMQHESNFFNAKDDLVRSYQLFKNDVFTLSAEGFIGTPEIGKAVAVEGKKLKVATA